MEKPCSTVEQGSEQITVTAMAQQLCAGCRTHRMAVMAAEVLCH